MAPRPFSSPKVVAFLYLFIVLFFSQQIYAQPGNLDSSFGNNGKLIFNGAQKILPSATGHFFVISTYLVFNNRAVIITKYSNDGLIDASYGLNGVSDQINIAFADAIIQPDGKIVIAGNTEGVDYPDIHHDLRVARVNSNGTLDASFGVGGYVSRSTSPLSYEFIKSVSLVQDKIIVKGFSSSIVGQITIFIIWLIDPDGTVKLVNDFSNQILPFATTSPVFNFGESVTGLENKIILAGHGFDPATGNDFSVARYLANGDPDITFNGSGKLTTDFGSHDAAKAAGTNNSKLIVAGSTYNLNLGQNDFAMARYNNDGSMDNSFNGNGKLIIGLGASAEVTSIVINNGKTIAGGFAGNAIGLAQINDNGSLDENFGISGKQITALTENILSFDKLFVHGNRLYVTCLLRNQNGTSLGMVLAYQLECPASIAGPSNKVVFTEPGKCNAKVNDIDAVISTTCGIAVVNYMLTGATNGSGTGSISGLVFNKGITMATYSLANVPSKSHSFTITVEDHEAPLITNAYASPNTLWPANHKMIDVEINYDLSDNCGASSILSVVSSEPDRGMGNDDVANDWQIIDPRHIRLRTERSGNGNGRTYTITILATDDAGNSTTKNVYVVVPHDKSGMVQNDLRVHVYPNPTTSYFTILTETKNASLVNIKVTDIYGRLIEVKSNVAPNSSIQIGSNYRVGLYQVEITQGKISIVKTVIKLPGNTKF